MAVSLTCGTRVLRSTLVSWPVFSSKRSHFWVCFGVPLPFQHEHDKSGPGKKVYVDGTLVHHGSLWTSKTPQQRHREHVRNCVKDSQAWRERQATTDLDFVVDASIEQFGECDSNTDRWYVPCRICFLLCLSYTRVLSSNYTTA